MTYELENEYSSDRLTSKRFITSSPMNLNSIIELIKSYEDDYTVLYEASVSSYDADGTYGTMTYTTVEK